jgi:hypothetical protein
MKRLLKAYLYFFLLFCVVGIWTIIYRRIQGLPIIHLDLKSLFWLLVFLFIVATIYYIFDTLRLYMRKLEKDVKEYERKDTFHQKGSTSFGMKAGRT